jgi:hypothetical protein
MTSILTTRVLFELFAGFEDERVSMFEEDLAFGFPVGRGVAAE